MNLEVIPLRHRPRILNMALACSVLATNIAVVACETTEVAPVVATKAPAQAATPVSTAHKYAEAGETYNPEAPIPAQCYTKTEGVHNPCYVCHQTYTDVNRPNRMNDGFQQGSYAFSEQGETNSWKNLFRERSEAIGQISDEEIEAYVKQDNYSELVRFMQGESWTGEVLELRGLQDGAQAFDEFGLAKDGSRWVAFNYKPFPSTFWPTNGSTDDTMIRLPSMFSEVEGKFSRELYYANLALLEMAIVDSRETSVPPLDETLIGVDLDGDKKLTRKVTKLKRREYYMGDAKEVALTHMLYPEGTEFLHTVRYIGVSESGGIYPAQRFKELRYMKKSKFNSKEKLRSRYYDEAKEKHFERLPQAVHQGDRGVSNSFGWSLLGFIEDERGKLRKQSEEEHHFCVGCHKSIGSTIDQTFAFPRKVSGSAGWRYIDLREMKDVPSRGESEGEILTYFKRVGGGDEFRQNPEMLERWFDEKGRVREDKVTNVKSVFELIAPSGERAMALNKAYLATVKEQSFLLGRDVVLAPARNVLERINTEEVPLREEHRYQWDIRLDW